MMERGRYEALSRFHKRPEHEAQRTAWYRDYEWATETIERQFSGGIEALFSQKRLSKAYKQFQRHRDPIYHAMLQGMNDEPLAQTFVSYWKLGQSLATRSRFWLERALEEVLIQQALRRDACDIEIYNKAMLRNGLLSEHKPIAEMGHQGYLEYQAPQGIWEVQIKTSVLNKVDELVAEQERVAQLPKQPHHRIRAQSEAAAMTSNLDRDAIYALRKVKTDKAVSSIPIRCNLIIYDPNKVGGTPMVNAIRFINPRVLDKHTERKEERINLLRLYAYLIQEFNDIDPRAIRVRVAELLPRYSHFDNLDHYPQYFSDRTYWTAIETWGFIGVPLPVIKHAIKTAATQLRTHLTQQLRAVLPSI